VSSLHRAQGAPAPLARRSLVKGAAWTLPVLAVAAPAPAYAVSPCTTLTSGSLVWSNASEYNRTSANRGDGMVPLGSSGSTVGVAIESTFTGYTALTTAPANLSVLATVGNTGAAGLSFTQVASSGLVTGNPLNNQTVKFTFTQAVYHLSFLLTDFDYLANQYQDGMAISGPAFTATVPSGSTVVGSGTMLSPFRSSGTAAYDNSASGARNVKITFAGPVSTFSLVYWNLLTVPTAPTLSQGSWMGTMSLQGYPATC
jgi:hypothetical protein